MNKKPDLSDYGLSLEDWETFSEAKKIRKEKENYSPTTHIVKYVIISICLTIVSKVAGILIGTGFKPSNYNWNNFFENPWELVVFAIGFALLGYINYKRKIKKINEKADLMLNTLSNKKLEMLQKYTVALEEFEVNNKEELNKKLTLEQDFKNCNEEVAFVKNNGFFNYNTEQLTSLISDLFNKQYKKCETDLFDFYDEENLIKCIGIDSFISKIEAKEMLQFLSNSKYEGIIIYSLIDIDNDLISNSPQITIKDKFDIKSIYQNAVEKDLNSLTIQINNSNIEKQENL